MCHFFFDFCFCFTIYLTFIRQVILHFFPTGDLGIAYFTTLTMLIYIYIPIFVSITLTTACFSAIYGGTRFREIRIIVGSTSNANPLVEQKNISKLIYTYTLFLILGFIYFLSHYISYILITSLPYSYNSFFITSLSELWFISRNYCSKLFFTNILSTHDTRYYFLLLYLLCSWIDWFVVNIFVSLFDKKLNFVNFL